MTASRARDLALTYERTKMMANRFITIKESAQDIPHKPIGLSLTPRYFGDEVYDITPKRVRAYAGTGFNENNPQHYKGVDAVRYAIAIQQSRDRKDYFMADIGCNAVKSSPHGFKIKKTPDYTEIVNECGEDWYVVEDAETGAQILMGPL